MGGTYQKGGGAGKKLAASSTPLTTDKPPEGALFLRPTGENTEKGILVGSIGKNLREPKDKDRSSNLAPIVEGYRRLKGGNGERSYSCGRSSQDPEKDRKVQEKRNRGETRFVSHHSDFEIDVLTAVGGRTKKRRQTEERENSA